MWWCNFLTVEILLSYSQEFNQHDNTRLHVFAYKACRTPSSAQSPDKLAADRKEKLETCCRGCRGCCRRQLPPFLPEFSANCLLCVLQYVIALSSLTPTRLHYIHVTTHYIYTSATRLTARLTYVEHSLLSKRLTSLFLFVAKRTALVQGRIRVTCVYSRRFENKVLSRSKHLHQHLD